MAEWSIVPDSKSGVLQGTEGSNPSLSARCVEKALDFQGLFLFVRGLVCQLVCHGILALLVYANLHARSVSLLLLVPDRLREFGLRKLV